MNALSNPEYTRFKQLECVIEQGLGTFVDVGNALAEIRNSQLYRDEAETFESYCAAKWDMQKSRAYQLIDSAKVVEDLSTMVDIPTNERQVRPLARLGSDKRREVWSEVLRVCRENGVPVTAEMVEEMVQRIDPAVTRKPREPLADGDDASLDEIKMEFDRSWPRIFIGYLKNFSPAQRQKIQDMIYAWIDSRRAELPKPA